VKEIIWANAISRVTVRTLQGEVGRMTERNVRGFCLGGPHVHSVSREEGRAHVCGAKQLKGEEKDRLKKKQHGGEEERLVMGSRKWRSLKARGKREKHRPKQYRKSGISGDTTRERTRSSLGEDNDSGCPGRCAIPNQAEERGVRRLNSSGCFL